jgi:diguanylate cyclase (GGDEF)-like protein/PAS domain S-box-containing protein
MGKEICLPRFKGKLLTGASMLHGSYDYRLVALSVALAMFSAYAALDLAGRVTAARRWARVLWLAGGATSMGLGIWSMHYIGMLAFSLPVPVLYHYPTVIWSLLTAIAASAVALFTVSRERMGVPQEILGSLVMGGGIAAMHYIGMAAMRLPAMMEYRWNLVLLSIVLAVVISLVALQLSFRIRQEKKISRGKIVSAVVMGSAIPLMHYTGMWAVRFHLSDAGFSTQSTIRVSPLGIAVIVLTSFSVMILAIGTAFLDRLLAMRMEVAGAAQEGEARFRNLAMAIPQTVWTAAPDGAIDYFNRRWFELTGFTEEQSLGWGWKQAVHPDDLPFYDDLWKKSLHEQSAFEMEYRVRNASQSYRWQLVRAVPVRDTAGKIVKWFGACTDIEEQKQNLQALEEQIRERTAELADANTRLQEEMLERDFARQRLDEQNEKMVSDLTARSQRATMLAKMGELLQSCLSKDEVFAAALGFGPKIFPSQSGALALLTPDRSAAEVAGSWHDCLIPMSAFEMNSCWALRTGHPHLVVAGDMTARCAHAAGVEHTYLCIPILAQGEALGILHFQATAQAPVLADSELSLKNTFAGQIGLSIANIRLREALRSQSIKDPLTGLYNRRYLTEMLEREIRRAVRSAQGLGILMLDLDHFKKFNDTYGHDAGDTVLREAASFLSKSIRVEDMVCRFGGEEFVIILPTANLEAAHGRAERIRSKVRELTVLHHGQSLGMITVSVGVSALPRNGTTAKELLDAADAALYRAKREGRDRVMDADQAISLEPQAAAAALAAAQ